MMLTIPLSTGHVGVPVNPPSTVNTLTSRCSMSEESSNQTFKYILVEDYLQMKQCRISNLVFPPVSWWYEYLDHGLGTCSSVQWHPGHHDVWHGGVADQGLQL